MAVRHIEGMKHAETGQLFRRTRAQQPAFLGHDGLRKTALKTSNGWAGISPPFCLCEVDSREEREVREDVG